MRLKPIGRPQSNPSNSGYPRLKDGFEFAETWMVLHIDCFHRKAIVPAGSSGDSQAVHESTGSMGVDRIILNRPAVGANARLRSSAIAAIPQLS